MDPSMKLMPNFGQAVSQLEHSKVIGCLMYVMTIRKPDIAFVVGRLGMFIIIVMLILESSKAGNKVS